jgi:hypothetical protein
MRKSPVYLKEYGCFYKNKYGNPEKQFTILKRNKAEAEKQALIFSVMHNMEFMYVLKIKKERKKI